MFPVDYTGCRQQAFVCNFLIFAVTHEKQPIMLAAPSVPTSHVFPSVSLLQIVIGQPKYFWIGCSPRKVYTTKGKKLFFNIAIILILNEANKNSTVAQICWLVKQNSEVY